MEQGSKLIEDVVIVLTRSGFKLIASQALAARIDQKIKEAGAL